MEVGLTVRRIRWHCDPLSVEDEHVTLDRLVELLEDLSRARVRKRLLGLRTYKVVNSENMIRIRKDLSFIHDLHELPIDGGTSGQLCNLSGPLKWLESRAPVVYLIGTYLMR